MHTNKNCNINDSSQKQTFIELRSHENGSPHLERYHLERDRMLI